MALSERDARRALADRLFEIIHTEPVQLSLDALGMTMTHVLLETVLVPGKTHREVFEEFMEHMRKSGERVMEVLDFPNSDDKEKKNG